MIFRNGKNRAIGLLIDDLYRVWRAVEGLPVWPTKREEMTGHRHGGIPIPPGPEMLSVEEALARCGAYKRRPALPHERFGVSANEVAEHDEDDDGDKDSFAEASE